MAVKDILVHIDTSESGVGVNEFALSLASRTGSYLTAAGLAIQFVPSSAMDDGGGYASLVEITEQSKADARAAYDRLKSAATPDVQTDFIMIEGVAQTARERFGELGRHFDLSIVGQGTPVNADDGLMVEGALYGSGRPVFVVPAAHRGPAALDKVLVCWDGGLPAARAVAGALSLLRLAKQIEVVTVAKSDQAPEELPGFNITRHLSRHGLAPTLKKLPPAKDAGEAILAYAKEFGADFIVMGAFGHWRLREFILGGATRTALDKMGCPLLMSH